MYLSLGLLQYPHNKPSYFHRLDSQLSSQSNPFSQISHIIKHSSVENPLTFYLTQYTKQIPCGDPQARYLPVPSPSLMLSPPFLPIATPPQAQGHSRDLLRLRALPLAVSFSGITSTQLALSSEMSKPTCRQGRASCETLGPSTGGDQQSLAFLSLQLYHLNLFFCHNLGFSQCVSVFTWHFRYWSYWIRAHLDGLILTWLHRQRLSPNKLTFTDPKG